MSIIIIWSHVDAYALLNLHYFICWYIIFGYALRKSVRKKNNCYYFDVVPRVPNPFLFNNQHAQKICIRRKKKVNIVYNIQNLFSKNILTAEKTKWQNDGNLILSPYKMYPFQTYITYFFSFWWGFFPNVNFLCGCICVCTVLCIFIFMRVYVHLYIYEYVSHVFPFHYFVVQNHFPLLECYFSFYIPRNRGTEKKIVYTIFTLLFCYLLLLLFISVPFLFSLLLKIINFASAEEDARSKKKIIILYIWNVQTHLSFSWFNCVFSLWHVKTVLIFYIICFRVFLFSFFVFGDEV